jgi:hypothetical protein
VKMVAPSLHETARNYETLGPSVEDRILGY